VRSLGLLPESLSLTTGTFNLVVKDRIALRLSDANSVQETRTNANPTVLETLPTYSAAENPVNVNIPQAFHIFCTRGKFRFGTRAGELARRPKADPSR